jgi:hypothetical protein
LNQTTHHDEEERKKKEGTTTRVHPHLEMTTNETIKKFRILNQHYSRCSIHNGENLIFKQWSSILESRNDPGMKKFE